jgi:bacterioferritin (cytochrome b1)
VRSASLNGQIGDILTHAAVITGPYAEAVAARLTEIAENEKTHAAQLRDRITALNGTPTMEIAAKDLIPATTLKDILTGEHRRGRSRH